MVVDDLAGAVRFLREVLGATGDAVAGRPAEVRVGDSLIMVTEAGEREVFPAFLYVYVVDADASYARALAAGAVTLEEPLDTPYGDRRAMVRDPFGNVLELQEILDHLLEEGNRHSRHSEEIALQYLRLFLQKLPECVEYSPHRAASQALEFYLKAKTFLEKNHETLATAEAAAGSLGVTPETLCRVFQRFARTTPYQYLLRLKINRAVDLLLGTSLQAKEVGYRLGFGDPFHFSRVFKRLQGSSPANFRLLRGRGQK